MASKRHALARPLTDPRHLIRFLKSEAGLRAEDIAKDEHVSVATVRQSIMQIDGYRKRNSSVELDLSIRDLVISAIPAAKAAFEQLLNATELVEVPDGKTGKTKVIEVIDKTTRLETLRAMSGLIGSLQPKQPPVAFSVHQNNNTATVVGSGETSEERLRRLRQQAREHAALPPEVAGVPEHLDQKGLEEGEYEDEDDGDEDE